jgi:hypothetical protein
MPRQRIRAERYLFRRRKNAVESYQSIDLRLDGEIARRTEVVGIFPNEDAIVCLIGAILLER